MPSPEKAARVRLRRTHGFRNLNSSKRTWNLGELFAPNFQARSSSDLSCVARFQATDRRVIDRKTRSRASVRRLPQVQGFARLVLDQLLLASEPRRAAL
jgi:hypothetical protein